MGQLAALLVGWSVEEDDGEDVQVPHAKDPREESTVALEGVAATSQVTLTDLETEHLSW